MRFNEIVGNCGLKNIDFNEGLAEFGIILLRSSWGKGYSKEAQLLCLDYAFNELKLIELSFHTDENNSKMKKVQNY